MGATSAGCRTDSVLGGIDATGCATICASPPTRKRPCYRWHRATSSSRPTASNRETANRRTANTSHHMTHSKALALQRCMNWRGIVEAQGEAVHSAAFPTLCSKMAAMINRCKLNVQLISWGHVATRAPLPDSGSENQGAD
eukprot:360025-Chlamydomonas_euryale.AAC.7